MAIETASSPVVPHAIVQTEADNILWSQLILELSRHYEATLRVVFPAELNERTYSWFHSIEDHNFRSELRYTFDEMKPILAKPELLFLFLLKDEFPEIVVLGYTKPDEPERVFRLDTFAINKRGKGIGHIVMDYLIKWARAKQYVAIELDTEETDEKGIRLQRFYEKHKFVVVARDSKGDLTMRCALVETRPEPPASAAPATSIPNEPPQAPAPPTSATSTSPTPADIPPASTAPTSPPPTSNPPPEMPPTNTPLSATALAPTAPSPASIYPPTTTLVTAPVLLAPTPPPSTPPATMTPPMARPNDEADASVR